MAAAHRSASIDYFPLNRGGFRARLTVADLGTMQFQHCDDDAHITRGLVEPGVSGVVFATSPLPPGTRANGETLVGNDAVLLSPGSELFVAVPAPLAWGALTIRTERLAALLDDVDLGAGGLKLMPNLLQHVPGLRTLLLEVDAMARESPTRLEQEAVGAAITEAAHAGLARAVAAPSQRELEARSLGKYQRIVRQVEALLAAHPARALHSEEVGAVIGVSLRTLNVAFNAMLGMSPQRYLLVRRLHLARRRLRTQHGQASLVKTIALDLGFWHLGRFAQQYRAMFGESPSQTLVSGA